MNNEFKEMFATNGKFDELLNSPLPSKQKPIYSESFDLDEYMYEDVNLRKLHLSKGLKQVTISVYSTEGNYPHFHIKSNDGKPGDSTPKKNGFEACIRLDTNKYFNHGYKTGKLNRGEIKALLKILNSPDKENKNITVFTRLCNEWNRELGQKNKIEDTINIPDYLNMED